MRIGHSARGLLLANQPIPHESMFDDDRFEEFHSILQGRSEARVYLDLHPLLVPSAENPFISGADDTGEFGSRIQ